MPRGLQEAHILRVGFDNVQQVEIHALCVQSLAELPGDQQVAHNRRRGAVYDEECISEIRIEVSLHDQIRRLAIGQPRATDRCDKGADNHRMANRRGGCGRKQKDDDQCSDGQSDHGDAVEDTRRDCHESGHGYDGRHNSALIVPQ